MEFARHPEGAVARWLPDTVVENDGNEEGEKYCVDPFRALTTKLIFNVFNFRKFLRKDYWLATFKNFKNYVVNFCKSSKPLKIKIVLSNKKFQNPFKIIKYFDFKTLLTLKFLKI